MEKRVALPPLYPTAATDTAIGCQKSIREAVSTRTGLIPELVAIIVQYNTTIPLRVSTLTRKAKANELDRPHYAALWSPTQLLRSESGSGGSVSGVRLADDAVLLVTDYEHNLIQAINLVSGKITPFAGGEKSVVEGTKALEFRFSTPTGISVHPFDNSIFVTEFAGNVIRRIADGAVTTVCGGGGGGFQDGFKAVARLYSPFGIAISSCGKFGLISDYNNHRIRRVELDTGTVSTVCGSGGLDETDGSSKNGSIRHPKSIIFAPSTPAPDSVAYACAYDSLRRIDVQTGAMQVLRHESGYRPRDMCWIGDNKCIVSSDHGLCVTPMDSDGPEIALADPTAGLSDGPIRCAQFSYATGLVLLPHSSNKRCGGVDRCYVVDQSNNTIRIVTGTVFGVL